jgi:amino acid adenylation domain-containing protein
MPHSIDVVVSMLAVIKTGAAFLPIALDVPIKRIKYIVSDAKCRYFLVNNEIIESAFKWTSTINVNDNIYKLGNSINNDVDISQSDILYVIYTSGTTGTPKGVMASNANLCELLFNDRAVFSFNSSDTWILLHPISFDFSIWEIFGSLLNGSKLILIGDQEAKDPKVIYEAINKYNINILNQTPSAFYILSDYIINNRKSVDLDLIIFGGEVLNALKLKEWRESFPNTRLVNMYGITETTIHVTYKEIIDIDIRNGTKSVGKPLPYKNIYIMNEDGEVESEEKVGEICVGGSGVSLGYINNIELTKEKFVENPINTDEIIYKSGDLGRILKNGEIEYLGRKDNQVQIRGYRVELSEIESNLVKVSGVKQAIVLASQEDDNVSIKAYLKLDKKVTIEYVRNGLKDILPDYMIPHRIYLIENIPLTNNRKIDHKLLEKYSKIISSEKTKIKSRTKIEKKLSEIWQNVLGVDEVYLNDDFFAIGGDSIKVIRILSRTNKAFDVDLEIQDVYRNGTIEHLATEIEQRKTKYRFVNDSKKSSYEDDPKFIHNLKSSQSIKRIVGDNYVDILPMTKIESGMIYSSIKMPDTPVYYDQVSYRVKVKSLNSFADALNVVVKKHPNMMSGYYLNKFIDPLKIQYKDVAIPITYENIIGREALEQEQVICDYLKGDLERRYVFEGELLWRIRIFILDEQEIHIVLSFHHAMMDGWSKIVFLTDISKCLVNRDKYLNECLSYSYKDYANRIERIVTSKKVEKYWTSLLKDYQRTSLPFCVPNKHVSLNRVSDIAFSMENEEKKSEIIKSIRTLCAKRAVSMKSIFVSAHLILLYALTDEDDILTGVVSHDRPPIEGSDKVIGCFLNTLPIRLNISNTTTYGDVIDNTNRYLIDVKENEIHLSDIAKMVGEVNTNNNPLFDSLINYTDFHLLHDWVPTESMPNIGKIYRDGDLSGKEMTNTLFDLEIGVSIGPLVQVKYSPEYFKREHIEYAICVYNRILECFINCIDNEIDPLDFYSDREKNKYIDEFNNNNIALEDSKTVIDLFEQLAYKYPSLVAYRVDCKQFTYGYINKQANKIAKYLVDMGAQRGNNIGVLGSKDIETIICIIGIMKAGSAYVPIDRDYPHNRMNYIIEDSDINVIFITGKYYIERDIIRCRKIVNTNNIICNEQVSNNINLHTESSTAYIIYTSGSTGKPKGVIIKSKSLTNLVDWVNKKFEVKKGDRLLSVTSIGFDLSVYDLFGTLSCGGMIVVPNEKDEHSASGLLNSVIKHKITFWNSVPSTLHNVLLDAEAMFDRISGTNLRLVFLSGDWVPLDIHSRVKKYFKNAEVVALGGATEATIWSNYHIVNEILHDWSSIPYGIPIQNTSYYVLGKYMKPVIPGVIGELYIGGIGVAQGYCNDVARTNNSFIYNPYLSSEHSILYKTGDYGRMMHSGEIEFIGRKDNLIKINGYRVSTQEIEKTIRQVSGIESVIVLPNESKNGNPFLSAFIIKKNESIEETCLRKSIVEKLINELPVYMVPENYVFVRSYPLTNNGKIDRELLLLSKKSNSVTSSKNKSDATKMVEHEVARVLLELLDSNQLKPNDNIFEAGCNSLLLLKFIHKIRERYLIDLPIAMVFENATIESISNCVCEILESKEEALDFPPLERVSRDNVLLPSYAQQRLWLLDQIDDGSAHYNIGVALTLTGDLNHKALNLTFSSILERHESLRTCFIAGDDDGQPIQLIQEIKEYLVPILDLSDLTEDVRQSRIVDVTKRETSRGFDLAHDLMLRARLLKVAKREHILLVTMHHIASDGWSMGILINEFNALYGAYVEGKENPLDPLSIQYADYTHWQREWLQGDVLDKQLSYWVEQLADLPVAHNLPLDHPRPNTQTFAGKNHYTHVNSIACQTLLRICESQGATLFMGLHAVFSTLLSRYSNETDIVMGSPIANREQAEVANLIGFFVNTLVLRSDLSDSPTFLELLNQSKQTLLDAYAHQQVPFDQIVERLQPERNLSISPLFQVMLVLQNNEQVSLNLPGLTLSSIEQTGGIAKYDLTLNVSESDRGLDLVWEYNTDLFETGTIERMAVHFELLLQALIKLPEENVFKVEMLKEEERHLQLVEWNDTSAEYPKDKCIHELFEEQVELHPNNVALVFEDKQLTYHELNSKANQLAHYLIKEKQVKPDTLVGICVERSLEMVIGILGILKAGGAYVPLDPDYPEARIQYMIDDAQLATVLTQRHVQEKTCVSDEQVVCLGEADVQEQLSRQLTTNTNAKELGLKSNHLAYVIYTSGSTGHPKGVMIEHQNTVALLHWARATYDLKQLRCVLALTSVCFDLSVFELFTPLSVGCSAIVASGILDLQKSQYLDEITLLNTVPSTVEALLSRDHIPKSLKTINLAGEPLKQKTVDSLYGIGIDSVYDLYGPSEDTTYTSFMLRQINGVNSIGKPISNTQLYVLNKQLNIIPQGAIGELYIGGCGLARGYLNNSELTKEKFIANPFYDKNNPNSSEWIYMTGDLVRWLPDGNLVFVGRLDHQVKIRGFRIELGEIEHVLTLCDGVNQVVVLAKEAESGDKRLVAYVEANAQDGNEWRANSNEKDLEAENGAINAARQVMIDKLRRHVKEILPDYMVPSAFVLLGRLPLTPNGKVNRKALPEPNFSEQQIEYIAPCTEAEKNLCGIWQEILGVERVGLTDNFFSLGGHSLLAIKIINRIEQRFGVTLDIKNIFMNQTIEDISKNLDSNNAYLPIEIYDEEIS